MSKPSLLHQKGLNDRWVRPQHVQRVGPDHYRITLREPLGQSWTCEIVSFPIPAGLGGKPLHVTLNGYPVPYQIHGDNLALEIRDLNPGEERIYDVRQLTGTPAADDNGIRITRSGNEVIMTNGLLSLRLAADVGKADRKSIPGPLIAVRRGQGPWLGRGRLESPFAVRSVKTGVIETGALWTTVEVACRFEGGYAYRMSFRLRPGEDSCEVDEESTLPVRLWPAPRPYREIGSLGASFWKQDEKNFAKPCLRPCPTSNFIFDLRAGFRPDRMVTHSTSSWEIMDVPLGAATLKTYTAMRMALLAIDGAWMGVYDGARDELLGVAARDVTQWRVPDLMIHPAHRIPGASAEVILLDSKKEGSWLRFPVENVRRHWMVAVCSRKDSVGLGSAKRPEGKALRLEPNADMPLWKLYRRRGALTLNKVKDWIVDWPDAGEAHPRVFCKAEDFPAIRKKVRAVPELHRNYLETRQFHAADRYLIEGKPGRLAEVEEATHAKELVQGILDRGYAGPTYALGLSRPMRRYAMACDILWNGFTADERREARRVCALAAYIMTDGDWWQYVLRKGETTYLPNFNSDVFGCAGMMGMFLSDHPCSQAWTRFLVDCMDLELERHVRLDGGGEENVGAYLPATWGMFYFPPLWALRHCGIKDYSKDPRVLAGARFFLKAIEPENARDNGLRQLPPIGHHPHARKALPLAAFLAAFVKKSDPALAKQLMWAWRATGSVVYRNGDHTGLLGEPLTRHYIFHDPTISAVAPSMESHNLPHVGAVLRSHDMSGKGSYVFLKAGRVHSHHDEDEGSFHYYGRGVPLALDGLPVQNGATATQHNAVTFGKYGQPSGLVERFVTTPAVDYVRARIAPRGFCSDTMYVDDTHRSGWERQILMVKAHRPGGVEYVVVKDTACGPDACQWNLDVLSRKPVQTESGRIWFPGHREPGFGMGLDVTVMEPFAARMVFEEGVVNEGLKSAAGRRKLLATSGGSGAALLYTVTEHWLLHLPAAAGSTFVVTLFPRRQNEMAPVVRYLEREETVEITHGEGRDLIFLRPNPMVDTSVSGALFRGRAGLVRERKGRRTAHALDASCLTLDDYPSRRCTVV